MGLKKWFNGSNSRHELKKIQPLVDKVLGYEDKYKKYTDEALRAETDKFKKRLKNGETTDDILPEAFAVCREASWRVLGMKHFPVQIIGGIILHRGRISEMKTGEGKTLVATLPAYLNALTGEGVHVVTVNEYLAKRDAEWMGKIYRFLGLTVGILQHDSTNEQRKAAYNADITYATNNELGFDYLRDNMVVYKENKVQRGHAFAIVDEVDSILIDEARTPLIISGPGDKSTDLYEKADQLARTMKFEKVTQIDAKEDNDDLYVEKGIDYIVDEKAQTATLTPVGVKKAEAFFGIENLTDPDNITIQHHINQAIKAHGVMKKDIQYVVNEKGEVIIVDEFTGRLMYGRRYNEGLHQAIEAKEGVTVERESKTLATITFQNFFRLYKKLSGMTGTAMTEETEFSEIYGLDVIEIPTNKPVQRVDLPDVIFKTEKGKFDNLIEDIIEANKNGQPVLVGTVSIDKSEELSALLKKKGIKHNVLNAKMHEKEAEIVAQAGKLGAVTIATNMAGRGTDIKLGGNDEFLAKAEMRRMGFSDDMINEATGYAETEDEEIINARNTYQELLAKYKKETDAEAEKVREAGGLFIMGTERHESRRIDNQLRGRSGRQGDPGASRFYLSAEDSLLRLFAGDRISMIMDKMPGDEDTPLESKLLSKTIESAQAKVEGRNFNIRKSVLEYDDVMNRQREIIYGQRDQVLNGENLRDTIIKMIADTMQSKVAEYLPHDDKDNWNLDGLREALKGWLIDEDDDKTLVYTPEELDKLEKDYLIKELTEKATKEYEENEKLIPEETMREIERVYLLKNVDRYWMDHIDAMEELKRGIRLRSYGQHDPVVEYRIEGFDMFDDMIKSIREDTVQMLMVVPKRVSERLQEQNKMRELAVKRAANGRARAAAMAALKAQNAADEVKEEITAEFNIDEEINTEEISPEENNSVNEEKDYSEDDIKAAAGKFMEREQVAQPTSTNLDGEISTNKTIRKTKKQKVGRNDLCPCGSGKKYKKCCGKNQ
ncbi:MAG: preprotein translocase subunit SecA [Clostridia bacterium]|nr:preprotein translocase subunit SecA [Clostridia bacterium]